jgi:hypothetical protein
VYLRQLRAVDLLRWLFLSKELVRPAGGVFLFSDQQVATICILRPACAGGVFSFFDQQVASFHSSTSRWRLFILRPAGGVFSFFDQQMASLYSSTSRWRLYIFRPADGVFIFFDQQVASFHSSTSRWRLFILRPADGVFIFYSVAFTYDQVNFTVSPPTQKKPVRCECALEEASAV